MSTRRCRIVRWGTGIAALVIGLGFVAGCKSGGVDENAELKTSRLAELAKPGTVLIVNDYVANVQVPNVTVPEDRKATLQQRLATMVQQGQIGSDEASVINAAIKELFTNWRDYFVATESTRQYTANMSGVGSGFFVTPDGYVVTNAHVVMTEGDELKQGLVNNALTQLLDEEVNSLLSQFPGADEETKELLRKACVEFYVETMRIDNVERKVSVNFGAGSGASTANQSLPAEVLENAVGKPIPGKDVAILKVAGNDFPTLRLGNDQDLDVGERIYPIGFPADATFFPEFDKKSINESSMTQGLVSARKKMADGWDVIQTDAAIRGGNSGGPVLDGRGNVIGLATFNLIDQKTGTSAIGANFVVPATIVREFLARGNISPKESEITKLYREALQLADKKHYKLAKEKLGQIESLKPGQPWVAATKADVEKAPRPTSKRRSWMARTKVRA